MQTFKKSVPQAVSSPKGFCFFVLCDSLFRHNPISNNTNNSDTNNGENRNNKSETYPATDAGKVLCLLAFPYRRNNKSQRRINVVPADQKTQKTRREQEQKKKKRRKRRRKSAEKS